MYKSVTTSGHQNVSQQRISKQNYHSLTLQVLHINLLFTEALVTTHAENYEYL
jgi:hypothetical protein